MEIQKFQTSESQIQRHETMTLPATSRELEDLENLNGMLKPEMKATEAGITMESDFDLNGAQYSFKRDLQDGSCSLSLKDNYGDEEFTFTPLEFEGKDYGGDHVRPVRITWNPSEELLAKPEMVLKGDAFSPDEHATEANVLFLENRMRSFMDRFVGAAEEYAGKAVK